MSGIEIALCIIALMISWMWIDIIAIKKRTTLILGISKADNKIAKDDAHRDLLTGINGKPVVSGETVLFVDGVVACTTKERRAILNPKIGMRVYDTDTFCVMVYEKPNENNPPGWFVESRL